MIRRILIALAAFLAQCGTIPCPASDQGQESAAPAQQPVDLGFRHAVFVQCQDGDTAQFHIQLTPHPYELWMHFKKIRLKNVSCYEMTDPDPARQEIARQERAALAGALSSAKEITVQLTHQENHDRIVGVIWADGVNLCDFMRTFPQGGN